MKNSVKVTTFEEAQKLLDIEFPDSDKRADDCLMEDDFPCILYDNNGDWDVCYHGGCITYNEWEEEL